MSRYAPVRYRADVGFEMRCDDCVRRNDGNGWFWPLTTEFWNVKHGMSRCRACWLVYWRKVQAELRRNDPEARRAHDRERYRKNRRVILFKRRVHYEENRERILAKNRERYHARKERAA